MDMEHDPRRFFAVLVEESLQDMNDELHGRVVVVQHQNFVHRRLFGFRPRADDHTRIAAVVVSVVVAAHEPLYARAAHFHRRMCGQMSEDSVNTTLSLQYLVAYLQQQTFCIQQGPIQIKDNMCTLTSH
eukprot:TRINITY_DN21740_c0_g1_i1.p1 TRINITY_DN21740_c0_g1~~TRINITY_DN21740_c0_g1_i1.p1  ORF type:complete len:129 (+),score=8.55 TRINITY_DN21740_c0_g1_i1:44-430(+)